MDLICKVLTISIKIIHIPKEVFTTVIRDQTHEVEFTENTHPIAIIMKRILVMEVIMVSLHTIANDTLHGMDSSKLVRTTKDMAVFIIDPHMKKDLGIHLDRAILARNQKDPHHNHITIDLKDTPQPTITQKMS